MRFGSSSEQIQNPDTQASNPDGLVPLVYERLRAVARRALASERADHTLDATGLVHEAYLRLVNGRSASWSGEAHFFVAAAEAMRRVLVDHARARGSQKRGGGRVMRLGDITSVTDETTPEQALALDDAFVRLEQEDPRAAAVVRLRFYAGLSVEHVAAALGSSPRTVAREWTYARARLYELLTDSCDTAVASGPI